MRKSSYVALLVTMPLVLLGGSSLPAPTTERFIYQWQVWDATINDGEMTSYCSSQAFFTLERKCIFPPWKNVRLVEWGITATEALTTANGEDCEYRLRTGAYGSANGTEIASSQITVGQHTANTTCEEGTAELNAQHEQCTVILDSTDSAVLITGGGWWDVIADDVPSATACVEAKGIEFRVVVEESS